MTQSTGRQALLEAFDRLLDRALAKLNVDCSEPEKEEAKRHFVERYEPILEVLDKAEFPPIVDEELRKMESSIDSLPPAQVAAYLAAAPLSGQVQAFMHALAMKAAEQRLLEHMVQQADSPYGGN